MWENERKMRLRSTRANFSNFQKTGLTLRHPSNVEKWSREGQKNKKFVLKFNPYRFTGLLNSIQSRTFPEGWSFWTFIHQELRKTMKIVVYMRWKISTSWLHLTKISFKNMEKTRSMKTWKFFIVFFQCRICFARSIISSFVITVTFLTFLYQERRTCSWIATLVYIIVENSNLNSWCEVRIELMHFQR